FSGEGLAFAARANKQSGRKITPLPESGFWGLNSGSGNSTEKQEGTRMRNTKFLLVLVVIAFLSALAAAQMAPPPPAKTPGDAISAVLTIAEGEFVGAADAMPEDKYSFAPSSGEFKGVRTFGEQVKHVAATNYIFGAAILNEKPP